MQLFYSNSIKDDVIILDKIESNHCLNVLRYSLGEDKFANILEQAVSQVLTDGFRTKDIYSDGMICVGTNEMGDAVIKTLSTLLV